MNIKQELIKVANFIRASEEQPSKDDLIKFVENFFNKQAYVNVSINAKTDEEFKLLKYEVFSCQPQYKAVSEIRLFVDKFNEKFNTDFNTFKMVNLLNEYEISISCNVYYNCSHFDIKIGKKSFSEKGNKDVLLEGKIDNMKCKLVFSKYGADFFLNVEADEIEKKLSKKEIEDVIKLKFSSKEI